MAAPTLADYEYQFKDSGIKLNGNVALPFVDVIKITGLDMPEVNSVDGDVDGAHGGSVYAKYFNSRTIVFDCNVFADPKTADVFCDTLLTNFMPDDTNYPLYFKGAGITQRYIMCKAVGIKYDIDNLRGHGKTKAQIILKAEDPRKYINNSDNICTSGTTYTVTNSGNMNSFPVVKVVGAYTSLTLKNITLNKTLVITDTRVAGDTTIIDFSSRSVTINNVRRSSVVTTNVWWDLPHGVTSQYVITTAGGPPTSITFSSKSAWA